MYMLKTVLLYQTNHKYAREETNSCSSMSSTSNIYDMRGRDKTSILKLIFLVEPFLETIVGPTSHHTSLYL